MFAKTLKQIGEDGTSSIFFKGSLGEKIVKEIQSLKGIITMEDLKSYKYFTLLLFAMFVNLIKLKVDILKSSFSSRLLKPTAQVSMKLLWEFQLNMVSS